MKRLFPFLLLTALVACKEVSFKESQPEGRKALTSFPKSLQGRYLVKSADGEISRDTVVVTAKGYRFGYFDPIERKAENDRFDKGTLGDSLVLKQYKGYYFLNYNDRPEWLLRVLKSEKDGSITYMTLQDNDSDFNSYLERLSSQIRIDSVTNDTETLYQISPSPGELVRIIEAGYVSKTILVRIR